MPPAITLIGFPPAVEVAQAEYDLTANDEEARTSGIGLTDRLDRLRRGGTGQPSAASENEATELFRITNKAAMSAVAFSLHCNSLVNALILR